MKKNIEIENFEYVLKGDEISILGYDGNIGVNYSKSKDNRLWVSEQTKMIGKEGINIKVAGNTQIIGGVIANIDSEGKDRGNLNIESGSISYEDIKDYEYSSRNNYGINVTFSKAQESKGESKIPKPIKSLRGIDISMLNEGKEKEQINYASIGNGAIMIGGMATISDIGINRNINKTQVITKDQITRALNAEVKVDIKNIEKFIEALEVKDKKQKEEIEKLINDFILDDEKQEDRLEKWLLAIKGGDWETANAMTEEITANVPANKKESFKMVLETYKEDRKKFIEQSEQNKQKHCNFDVQYRVAEIYDVMLPEGRANDLYEYFNSNSDGWEKLGKNGDKIDHKAAKEILDNDKIVMVAVYKNPNPNRSGHISLVAFSDNVIQIEQNFWRTGIVENPQIESFYKQFRTTMEKDTDIFYKHID